MITKYSITASLAEIMTRFEADRVESHYFNRFNISPRQNVSVVMTDRHGERILDESRWGLFPFWAPDSINADSSTLPHKAFFERMLRRQRCIVPCSGFFGWQESSKEKSPRAMHVVIPGESLFGMAGFYDEWRNASGELVRAFTIVTDKTSGVMSQWLPRLPIILDEDGIADWLNPSIHEISKLRKHLEPLESYQLRAYPVTNAIRDDSYESPDCIREIRADFA